MAKVLYITANPKATAYSYSLSVGEEFLNAYRAANPQDEIVHLDLYNMEVPFIDQDVFSGWGKLQAGQAFESLTEVEQAKVGTLGQLSDQFVSADKYVFVTPFWNFSFPPKMKAYIDAFCVAGKTFKYTAEGPVGLMSGKPAVHIQARGGFYSEGPAKAVEFGDSYLRTVLGFVGITDVESVIVEGQNAAPDQAEAIKAKAIENAKQVAQAFAAKQVTV